MAVKGFKLFHDTPDTERAKDPGNGFWGISPKSSAFGKTQTRSAMHSFARIGSQPI